MNPHQITPSQRKTAVRHKVRAAVEHGCELPREVQGSRFGPRPHVGWSPEAFIRAQCSWASTYASHMNCLQIIQDAEQILRNLTHRAI